MTKKIEFNRREALVAGAALATTGVAGQAFASEGGPVLPAKHTAVNVSGFRTQRWQDHFSSTQGGAILVDLNSFALHFWNDDRSVYRLYPIAVPLKEEYVRRGRTTVVLKRPEPTWSPTAAMMKRDPTLPSFVPAGPGNPLGTKAMNLGWQYYLIHGNNDTRKIGRSSSSGCIGLFNEHVEELYPMVNIGCQVVVI